MRICLCCFKSFSYDRKTRRSVALINPFNQEECSICLEHISDKKRTTMTKCGHIFHKKCIQEHFKYGRNYCPNCLQSII